jgi:hypothetical protein
MFVHERWSILLLSLTSLLSQIQLTDISKADNMTWPLKKHGLQKTATSELPV